VGGSPERVRRLIPQLVREGFLSRKGNLLTIPW